MKGADKVFETFPTNVHYEKLVGYWPGSQHWQEPFKTKDGSVLLFEALGGFVCILPLTCR